MNRYTITRDQLLELTKLHSYHKIAKQILHCKENVLDRLLAQHSLEKKPYHSRRHYSNILSTQKQMILGTLLGDASVVKKGPQHRLSLTHNISQLDYLEHQKEMLGELSQADIHITKHKAHKVSSITRGLLKEFMIKAVDSFQLHSLVHPYFTELREKLYQANVKTVCWWWLEQITPISLAYWVMDDGAAEYSDNSYVMRISTYCYTYDEHLLLQRFLQSRFGIEMQIQPTPNRGHGFSTRFRTEDSKRLRDLISPYIPICMRYKVDKEAWLEHSLASKEFV